MGKQDSKLDNIDGLCPRCLNEMDNVFLSHYDNKTLVCSECCEYEALCGFLGKVPPIEAGRAGSLQDNDPISEEI